MLKAIQMGNINALIHKIEAPLTGKFGYKYDPQKAILDLLQLHFQAKISNKTISDRIQSWREINWEVEIEIDFYDYKALRIVEQTMVNYEHSFLTSMINRICFSQIQVLTRLVLIYLLENCIFCSNYKYNAFVWKHQHCKSCECKEDCERCRKEKKIC